ncbi:RNA polymerase sigma factor [Sunxiuqinia sp. A32]|uniref:RNA polymerase sigma factor n=1 Tax=Sunxiuqinia sp. A32 TaxID=3461496 RepID=UPI0040453F61
MIPFEKELIKELKKGDHSAFERIFQQYSKQLFLFSLSYLKSREAAEDIVQEVFVKIWKNRADIRTDKSFQSYLFTITLNAVRKYFNKLSRINEVKHDIIFNLSEHKEEFDNRSDYQLLLDKLEELIEQMPEKRKVVFTKMKIEGKSQKEIAEELDISVKTVEYHISESMRYLKDEFERLRINGILFFHLFVQ